MLYADSYYKYKAVKGLAGEQLLPELNIFEKFLWKIKGYRVYRLPERPETDND